MMRFLGRSLRKLTGQVRGSVDAVTGNRIGGWAAGPGAVTVEVWLDGQRIGTIKPDASRPDVGAAFPELRSAPTSGFAFALPEATSGHALHELAVVAKPARPWLGSRQLLRTQFASASLLAKLQNAPDSGLRGPFPKDVIDLVAAGWPEDCSDLASEAGQKRFAARVLGISAIPELNALPAITDYVRFVGAMTEHCHFVARHFPVTNKTAREGANDYHCKPNSVQELFAIVHQLYVLKSWGVPGDFAEFGCFKGYSSAMLSAACAWLGIRMHIFDSFAGLPPAAGSSYEAGQFTGSIDEVRRNIGQFGNLSAVEFHPGFFSESLKDYRPGALKCLWMDVDLEVSARDLLVVADSVDPRGSVFSHECPPQLFRGEEIVAAPDPDNPIPPLLDRFEALGRPLEGQHVAGYTGAFWPRGTGIPVLSSVALDSLLRGIAKTA